MRRRSRSCSRRLKPEGHGFQACAGDLKLTALKLTAHVSMVRGLNTYRLQEIAATPRVLNALRRVCCG